MSTVYFQVISSYMNVQKKSGTTPYVVAGCAFLTLVFVLNIFLSNSHKVIVPTQIVQSEQNDIF